MGNILTEISSCEVCSNEKLIDVLNLGNHPLCDQLIDIGNPAICEEFPIEIVWML